MAVFAYLFGLMLQMKDKNGVQFDIALYNFQKNNIGQILNYSQTTNFNFCRCTHFLVLGCHVLIFEMPTCYRFPRLHLPQVLEWRRIIDIFP